MDELNEINNYALTKYYPFVGSPNFKKIFFSQRYLGLVEDYLQQNKIQFTRHEPYQIEFFAVTLPEYTIDDFICISTKNVPPHKFIYYCDNSIKIKKNITVETLYKALCSGYYANRWYNQIQDLTFESELIDLTEHEVNYLLQKTDVCDNVLLYKIDAAIKVLTNDMDNRVFVKLYSVSPKNEYNDDNTTRETNKFELTATDVTGVVKLLRKSERTTYSLENDLVHGIMLRRFIKEIDLENEFRLFVYDGKLRAISQYQCYQKITKYSDPLVQKKIYDMICNWWNKDAVALIPYVDCVIDVVIIDNEVKIIEINSFGPGLIAGSGLFNWDKDYDIMHYSIEPQILFYC